MAEEQATDEAVDTCLVCGTELEAEEGAFCDPCTRKYPPSLLKAHHDHPWDYVLKLRTGETWSFAGAEIHGDYATLTVGSFAGDGRIGSPPYGFERGVAVRVADIVWCADAPEGS